MSAIGDIVAAIEARMVVLTFKATDDVFNFDAVPNSIIDKAFRIENHLVRNTYQSDHLSNPVDAIEIYIAYKTYRTPRTVWKAVLADREAIEKDLINATSIRALTSDPLLTMDGEASVIKELKDYLVLKLVINVDYLRSVAP